MLKPVVAILVALASGTRYKGLYAYSMDAEEVAEEVVARAVNLTPSAAQVARTVESGVAEVRQVARALNQTGIHSVMQLMHSSAREVISKERPLVAAVAVHNPITQGSAGAYAAEGSAVVRPHAAVAEEPAGTGSLMRRRDAGRPEFVDALLARWPAFRPSPCGHCHWLHSCVDGEVPRCALDYHSVGACCVLAIIVLTLVSVHCTPTRAAASAPNYPSRARGAKRARSYYGTIATTGSGRSKIAGAGPVEMPPPLIVNPLAN
mmetsp:Transcript_6409/g.13826  ORF Transcript_6409/g.13826 Transcript_6409/m.13826 type:complete len:263 (+) Transcript_6409:76-864(+)|eukprot:CAMPEP_0204270460 /NCGR_PEP_ID=MMETSP0468-20130131/18912_1 /ASSEMBLY_ACC=CAM_ASM_000383 /TAXON_ID=2969 /ORGANISM="Oxyrrhis marina" /LENGTH=262 /DNA_ID=CAMNT_0051246001 /DNA_START=77 /DNA_END=865 /DNA_ORIENTATION=+